MRLSLPSFKPLFSTALSTTLLVGITSCQDEEFGYSADQIKYAKNFTEFYGQISANKSWDLSSSANAYYPTITRGSQSLGNGTSNENLVEGTHFVRKDYWEVPQKTLNWLKENLVEEKDNRWLGSNFVLRIDPSSDFAIIPIYQGKSAINSNLNIKINGYNLKEICPRSIGIQAKKTASSEWENLGYYDGWTDLTHDAFVKYKNGTAVMHPSFTDEDYAVRAQPIYFRASAFNHLQDDGFMYLDLINNDKMFVDVASDTKWDSQNTWTKIGDHLTSINSRGQMVALNLSWDGRPEHDQLPDIHEGTGAAHMQPSQVLIIGCEDAHGADSDYDVNDVVYMIIGYPNAPEVIPTTQLIKKRYMCEDLGATEDFDFNDMVIDVTQSMEYQLTTNPEGNADDYEYNGNLQVYMTPLPSTKKQWARISHVCGTLPFQVKVGDYFFPKVTDPTDDYKTRKELAMPAKTTRAIINIAETDGWNPNETKEITGWDPKENNIAICVEWNIGRKADKVWHTSNTFDKNSQYDRFADFASGNCKIVEFPLNGDVPYIIAVDQDIPWMKECVSIPDSWVQGKFIDRTGAAGPGSCAQYLDYGRDQVGLLDEAVIWKGDVFGKPFSTGVDLGYGNLSSTYLGIDEAMGKKFNIIAVYTDKPGSFGLVCDDSGWKTLTEKDAEDYVVSTTMVDGLYRTLVVLTEDQKQSIRNHGLIVTTRAEGMHIRQISMMRVYPNSDNYTVRFNKVTEGGRVTTTNYRRFNGENGEATVPFEEASFLVSESVTFNAEPQPGYKFDHWQVWNSGVNTHNIPERSLVLSNDIIRNTYNVSTGIIRIQAVFTQSEFNKVGAHIQVNNADNNAPGKIQISTNATFFNENKEALDEKSVTLANGEFIYVERGTEVTFTAPNHPDYKISEANYFDKETLTRTSTVDNEPDTPYTPYIRYEEKSDPQFSLSDLSQKTIVLDYNTPCVDIEFTKATSAEIKYTGYDYATEVNIWSNDKDGYSYHMRAQEKNFNNKKIKFYVETTDDYKAAEIEIDVTVQNYSSTEYSNGYRVPISNNSISAQKIKDALHWSNSNTKNIRVQVKRDKGIGSSASIYSSTHQSDWTRTIRENEGWTQFARGNDDWSETSFGMPPRSICFIISAEDFKNYFDEWNANITFDALTAANDGTQYTGWQEVYVSYTDDNPFQ